MDRFKRSRHSLALRAAAILSLTIGFLHGAKAGSFSDNFNDGNDDGWTRYDPFADVLGQPSYASFDFPDGNRLRISSPPSPDPNSLGAARAADVRADIAQTSFFLTVDLTEWNDNLDQIVGLLARGSRIGLGSTIGYVFMYDPRYFETGEVAGRLEIDRLDGEMPSELTTLRIALDPKHAYRLAFTGLGSNLSGEVFDLNAGSALVANLHATEDKYDAGGPGVVVADASIGGAGPADGTFDNFTAAATAARGDINRDGEVNARDISALLAALADLHEYALAHGIDDSYLKQIGDLDGDGQITNADLQSLLNALRGAGTTSVPEPSSAMLRIAGTSMLFLFSRRGRL
jgi:hypothetical protein